MKFKSSLLLCALSALWFAGCDGTDAQKQSVGNDWVHETPAPGVPVPAPTSTPNPNDPITPTESLYTGPPEVAKYVAKFISDAKIQGIDVVPGMDRPKLEIRIASLDAYGSSVIGLCESGSNIRRVTFDPDFWNVVNETQRELLAHHELGHCVLNRPHRSDVLQTGKYASIMYPVIMSSATYTSNYDYYQNELYTYKTSALEGGVDASGITTHICN